MRIGKTREQQQRLRQQRRERAAELATIGLTHKQIAERLGVAGSTVAALLAEGRQQKPRSSSRDFPFEEARHNVIGEWSHNSYRVA